MVTCRSWPGKVREGGKEEAAFLPGCLNFILFHKATAVIAFAAVTAAVMLAVNVLTLL